MTHPSPQALTLAALLAFALAACQNEDRTYEPTVDNESGGELIVATPTPGEVPVTVPETEMTNVPGTGDMAPAATPSPTPGATPVGEPMMDTAPGE